MRWLSGLLIALVFPIASLAQAPSIVTQPGNVSAVSGSNITLAVTAAGAAPLAYQWQLFGTNLPGRTNAALAITNVGPGNGGVYSVRITNVSGVVTSALTLVNVDEQLTFRILQLQTNGAIALECGATTGDDRGGLVVSRDFAFLTGDNASVRFSAGDLTGASSLGRIYDSLCSNLRDERIYLLANDTNLITSAGGTIDTLLELDPESGLPNGNRINLSTNITMSFGGIFSGYDRIVLWNGSTVYDIALPSGQVTVRGNISLSRTSSESWVSWGVAEYFTNTLFLDYVINDTFPYNRIVRSRVGSQSTPTTVAQFTNLADMANFSFSPSRSRWYFHMEGANQFRSGTGTIDETIGSAKATFSTQAGAPFIYRGPQAQTNFPGSNVTLSVVALGNGPFTYQWRLNGMNIDAPSSPTLMLSNLDPAMTGPYSVEVGNAAGGEVSAEAFVFVVTAPQILVDPQPQSALPASKATFSAVVRAAPPVSYQWLKDGANIPNATNATLEIPSVTAADVANYHLIVTNRYGSATSAVARLLLIVESAFSFKILSLGNDAVIMEHQNVTGDDRGGLSLSSNRVFVGGDTAVGMFSAADLSGGVPLATFYDALVGDLRTEKLYSLGAGTNLFRSTTSTVVNTFIEINGATGARTTNIINLSAPIPMFSNPGVFAGYGQVVLHNGQRAFSVAVPSGVVADLGAMSPPQHQFTETWAYWGVAENFGGAVYLDCVQNATSITRTRVPDGLATTIANFLNLSDMASISVSVPRGRWYFHYQGASQFGGSNQTVGYCSAAFSITPNSVVDHFSWEPLPGAVFSGVPFNATVTARTLQENVVTNFSGPVALAAFAIADGAPVAMAPSSVNFSNGMWTGQVTIPQPVPGAVIRATDLAARFGVSGAFTVATTNDLALVVTPSTYAATIYSALTYQLLLTNSGPESSSAVFATNLLPANVDFISVTAGQGSCSVEAGAVVCDIGTMASGSGVAVSIVVVPNAVGTMTNLARVVRSAVENHPENNVATTIIPVALPTITFNDAAALEGDSTTSRGTNVFTVQLNTTSAVPVSVLFATAPGTATNANDYVSRSGTLTFAPGVTVTNLRVTLGGDVSYEADEYFYVNFFNANNATLVRTQAIGTILNDDPPPTLVVTNTTVTEGNSGTTFFNVPVRLSAPAGVPISVNWATSNGTAIAGQDFSSTGGLLYYTNGNTNLFLSLPITGDTLGESNEFFYVRFFNGTNINVNTQIVVTILNDDPANVLHHFVWSSIGPTQVLDVPFNASLNARDIVDRTLSNYNGTVRLSSGASAAQRANLIGDAAPLDNFTGGPYTIGFSFTPSVDLYMTHVRHFSGTKVSVWKDDGTLITSRDVISVNGTWVETPLSVPVKLSAGTTYRIGGFNGLSSNPWYYGSSLPAAFKHGTIGHGYYNLNDAFPTIDLGASLYLVDMSYVLSLVTFSMTPTNITFTNGNWSGPVRVQTPGTDFRLFATDTGSQVSSASGAFDVLLVDDLAVQITPSADPAPVEENLVYSIAVSNAGPTASTGVFVTNRLPDNANYISASVDRGSFGLLRSNGSIVASFGTLTNGEVAALTVVVHPDGPGPLTNVVFASRNEPEVFVANNAQTNIVNAVPLSLSVNNVFVVEGHSGATNAVFNVFLSAASTQAVSVSYATTNASATAGLDYQAVSGVLTFPPGVTNLPVAVPVFGDSLNEINETFLLNLLSSTNAPIARSFGTNTIVNDDPLPMISISDITVLEGRNGLTPAVFTLTLSPASGRTVTVFAATSDGTASASDYVSTNGFITFQPGQTTAQMVALVRGDSNFEPDEYFLVTLSFPGNATLATAEARCTILNDDVGAGIFDRFEWSAIPSPQTTNRGFDVTLTARDGVGAAFPFSGTAALAAWAGTNGLPLAPTNSGSFANGTWSGTLTLFGAGSNVVLVADDGAGHAGLSNPFDVNVADLALSIVAPPQVLIASPFTYTLRVTNRGPNDATSVMVSNALPADTGFVSASASAGACSFANGAVVCNLGALSNGAAATVAITLNPFRGGTVSNSFLTGAFEADPSLSNNVVSALVEITGDEDHDRLPDAWEAEHGLSSSDPNDANLDSDGDGHTNLQEYIAGTDPMDGRSVLKARASVQSGTAQIRFATVLNKRYVLERAPSPAGPWTALGGEITGDGDVVILSDTEPATAPQRFYRVQVLR